MAAFSLTVTIGFISMLFSGHMFSRFFLDPVFASNASTFSVFLTGVLLMVVLVAAYAFKPYRITLTNEEKGGLALWFLIVVFVTVAHLNAVSYALGGRYLTVEAQTIRFAVNTVTVQQGPRGGTTTGTRITLHVYGGVVDGAVVEHIVLVDHGSFDDLRREVSRNIGLAAPVPMEQTIRLRHPIMLHHLPSTSVILDRMSGREPRRWLMYYESPERR